MDDKTILTALDRYFTRLSQVGYMDYPKVYSLLVGLYLNNMFKILSEDDKNFTKDNELLHRAVNCLENSNCMFGFTDCNC